MLLLVPISFLRKLDSFRHTSYIAMFSVCESHHWFFIDLLIFDSIPGDYCHQVLLQTSGGCSTGGGNRLNPFHTQLCDHVPCAGVRVHVRAECETFVDLFARC